MDDFCGSVFWDWNLTWYTENPDFTPCFERTVLTFIPCLFLWIFASVDVFVSYSSPLRSSIPWSALNLAKCGVTLILILIEAAMILVTRVIPLNSIQDYVQYPVDLYIPILRAITLLLYLALLLYSKNHGIRSSAIQFIFWFLLSVSQAIRFRTVINHSSQIQVTQPPSSSTIFVVEVIYFPLVLGQFILNCWADVSPSYHSASLKNLTKPATAPPELSCSFLSKILFEWFTPLTWKGYRKPLEYSDLWESPPNIRCSSVVPRFDYFWPANLNGHLENTSTSKSHASKKVHLNRKSTGSVFTTCSKAFGLKFLFGFCIRVVPDIVIFVSPQILNLLINFVGSPDEPTWKGLFYAGILFLNALMQYLFAANGIHIFYQIGCSIKSALVSAVYRKSLLLSNSARKDQSTGEIVNRMSIDIVYFSEFTQSCNLLITMPVIVSIALYFLWGILGVAALAGVVVMILLLPLNAYVASRVQKLQKEQMAYKDQRTKLMNEILSGMKVIKLYAWEPSFERLVGKIREKELVILKKMAYWNALANFLSTCAPFMVAIGSFGTFVLIDSNNVLDAQTAFVSLSLFNIMNQPLTFLPILISNFIQASVGVKRLNQYMNSDEIDLKGISHDANEANPIVIENGTFAWEANNKTGNTLENINLQVRDGQLFAIVGPVGSGKSSLLSALLNELVKIEGRVNIRGTIAYVAQQAWIQNATVRDNILFGKPYDPIKYKKIVEACALKPDLEMLPAGDKTEIGEKGINLSGGQKARISLARAAYSNAEIYLLDDPLSAVDAHVGKHIFDKVIGPKGFLRKKTRLLVTHGLVHLPEMDNIVVMQNGRITETGSYTELQEKQGAFSEFLKTHTTTESQSTPQTQKKFARKLSREISIGVSDSESECSPLRRVYSTTSISSRSSLEPTKNKLIIEERPETEGVKASVYVNYFRSAGWLFTVGTLALYIIFQSFSVAANLWLAQWTNSNNTNQNQFYLGIYALLGFLQAIGILLASGVMALGTVKSAKVLHEHSLSRILRAPLQFFDVTPIGRIINRFSRDVDSLDNILPIFLRFFLNSLFNVFAVIVVISVSTPIFILVIIPMGIGYCIVQRFFICTSRQLKRLESVSRSPIYSHFGETITGASTIRAYNQQERFIQELESRQDHNIVSYYYLVSSNRWLQIRLELMGNTVVFFAALFAVLGRDTLSQGLVGLSVSYALQITMALLFVVRFTSDVENNIVAVERLKEYSECEQEAPWKVGMWRPPRDWPQEGKIEFKGYKTRYRPGLDLVLKGISCAIRAGEKVGIVGRTGAGKSSVTLGIFRIVEAAEGRILVDGEDISRFGLHDVRGNITIIPQEPMLFSGTLKVNLDPFEEKRDEELWRALELAHLRNFVRALPGGLDYEISEGGENLSVGQRQLVCLARALLRKTKILVLDEFTSAVDLDTEELILKTIREEFKDATVITIAHRLNTIMDSDRVLVLEKGEITEFDTPNNLLKNIGSVFYSMAKEAGLVNTALSKKEV